MRATSAEPTKADAPASGARTSGRVPAGVSGPRPSGARLGARIVTGLLLLAVVGGLVASLVLPGASADEAEMAARERATGWVGTVLFEALTPELLEAPIAGAEYRQLLAVLQAGVLADDRASRVRIWSPGGQLVFSTDQLDEVGTVLPDGDARIDGALAGDTVSVTTPDEEEPADGLAGTDERLYRTFVPLRLDAELGISGVAEIDQRYAAIEAEANEGWRVIRLALLGGVLVTGTLFLVAMRRPADAGPAEPPTGPGDRLALERAEKAEQELGTVTQRAEKAEASRAAAEAALTEALARMQQVEARATKAEAELERATRFSASVAPAVETQATTTQLERRLREAEVERERLGAQAAELRAGIDARDARIADLSRGLEQRDARLEELARELEERDAALARTRLETAEAGSTAPAGATEIDEERIRQVEELARQADARIAQAEELARRAQARVAEAEAAASRDRELVREVEARLAEAEAARVELTAQLEAARTEAPRAPAPAGTSVEGDADLDALRARVTELEDARRTDVAELQRAQESLANTQFEAAKAQKRIRELERELAAARKTVAEEAVPDVAAAAEEVAEVAAVAGSDAGADAGETGEAPSRRRKAARRRPPKEASADEAPVEAPTPEDLVAGAPSDDEPEPTLDDQALSLRERLARAAAARHRAPTAPGSGGDG